MEHSKECFIRYPKHLRVFENLEETLFELPLWIYYLKAHVKNIEICMAIFSLISSA